MTEGFEVRSKCQLQSAGYVLLGRGMQGGDEPALVLHESVNAPVRTNLPEQAGAGVALGWHDNRSRHAVIGNSVPEPILRSPASPDSSALPQTPSVHRTPAHLHARTQVGLGSCRKQRKIPMLVFHCASEAQVARSHEGAGGIEVTQVASVQELRVHVLVAVVQLQAVVGSEVVGGPDVDAATFASDGAADDLAIVRVSAQVVAVGEGNAYSTKARNVSVDALTSQIHLPKIG